jgi:hypothetical protein
MRVHARAFFDIAVACGLMEPVTGPVDAGTASDMGLQRCILVQ